MHHLDWLVIFPGMLLARNRNGFSTRKEKNYTRVETRPGIVPHLGTSSVGPDKYRCLMPYQMPFQHPSSGKGLGSSL